MLAALLMATALLSMGLVVFWIEPLGVLGVIEKLTPNVTYRVRTHLPVVALSFDDGPHPRFTLQVLERFLTVRHSLSLSVISHRLAQVWRKSFLAVFSALKCFATPLTAQQALVVHHLPF
jgi:hypothetical protein